ncbi:MAG: hypothetical protein AAF570_00780, partial [Bacteroidota bacterium]
PQQQNLSQDPGAFLYIKPFPGIDDVAVMVMRATNMSGGNYTAQPTLYFANPDPNDLRVEGQYDGPASNSTNTGGGQIRYELWQNGAHLGFTNQWFTINMPINPNDRPYMMTFDVLDGSL